MDKNIEDMNIKQYRKCIEDLVANHRCEGKAFVNVKTDEYMDFIKKVASDGNFSVHVYFDRNGSPLDGFLMNEHKEFDDGDIAQGDELLSNLKLSDEEMTQAILEYNNKQEK